MSHQRINRSLVGWVIGDEILPNNIKLQGNSFIKHSRDPFFMKPTSISWFMSLGALLMASQPTLPLRYPPRNSRPYDQGV